MGWTYLLTSFEGRITRQPFWMAVLVLWAVSIAMTVVAIILFGPQSTASYAIQVILTLAFIWPGLAVAVKRYHDRDKSSWWILIIFIPIIGIIWYIVELGFLRGTPGPNRFGPDPLGVPTLPGRV